MAYEKPSCSMNQLDKACKIGFSVGSDLDQWIEAYELLSNWRSSHQYPLNALNMTLRNRALSVDSSAVIAQRLKRLESVIGKLNRRSTMQMSQMQDVGGCRAVVSGMRNLASLRRIYVERPLNHTLGRIDDYVANPKEDGYRSVHFRYRFAGRATAAAWNGLRVEVQLRTKLQHSWGTAVETIDAFTNQNVKFGAGSEEWRRFFALMGSVHARAENQAFIPSTPDNIAELRDEVRDLEARLRVRYLLKSYSSVTSHIQGYKTGKGYWYLLELSPSENKIHLRSYPTKHHASAKLAYEQAEQRFAGSTTQAVLVSVKSISDLQKAYPNFFGDTKLFVSTLDRFLEERHLKKMI